MGTANKILIADRNPRIREFLRRELAASGHRVRSVNSAGDLLKAIYSDNRIDLLILDPDFPYMDVVELARKIIDRIPQIPVVLHCIRGTGDLSGFDEANTVHIEKNGHSIEVLKEAIRRLL